MTPRRWTLLVALLVDCDLRTATKLVQDGPQAVRVLAVRERAVSVLKRRRELEKAFLRACG